MNVIDKIVDKDWCIGCGICAVTCPSKNLLIDVNKKGEYSPIDLNKCIDGCNICLRVCPFNDEFENQDDISKDIFEKNDEVNYDEILGFYRNIYVGHAINSEHREEGSSGGITTLLFKRLLELGEIDAVISVSESNKDVLFKYSIIEEVESLNKQSGSKYYPVEVSKVLELVKSSNKRYAIIALPCTAFALRKAMKLNSKLRENIKYIFSVACGQLQNMYYSEMISLKSGIDLNNLKTINYRKKGLSNSAINYATIVIDKNGVEGTPHFNLDLPNYLWTNGFFMQNSCNICDDVFGEVADITFMDAWTDEYLKDLKGVSIALVRNKRIDEILLELEDTKRCSINKISNEKVKESQSGIIQKKRVDIAGRLYFYDKNNSWVPKRRVEKDEYTYKINKSKIKLKYLIQHKSKEIWYKSNYDNKVLDFNRQFKKYILLIKSNEIATRVKMKLTRLKR